jgi:predicted alpha-1,2-mannosidase
VSSDDKRVSRRRFLEGAATGAALGAIGLGSATTANAATTRPTAQTDIGTGIAGSAEALAAGRPGSVIQYVDTMIGAITDATGDACGKTYPGPVAPFGMVQLGPDTVTGGDNAPGYSADMNTIEGFSFTRMSGVGCYGDLGNLQVMPETGTLVIGRDDAKSPFSKTNETAQAGYYSVLLDRYQVRAELTATLRAGLLRFTFPQATPGRIKVDLTRRIGGNGSHSTAQYVKRVDANTVEGWMECDSSGGGWICGSQSPTYTVYFSMRFDLPSMDFGIWDGAAVYTTLSEHSGTSSGFFVEFPASAGQQVLVKAGISFVSMDNARANLAHDIPAWDFEGAVESARDAWEGALSAVAIEGATPDQQTIFHTALYHALLDPRTVTDLDGTYTGSNHETARAEGFTYRSVFSGWDVYRAEFPLLHVIEPGLIDDEVNSLMAMNETGAVVGLPRWELLGKDTNTMLGDPAVNIICEAYLKGSRGFDAEKAYAMCRAVVLGPQSESNRPGVAGWLANGYDSSSQSLSTSLENAYTDYCVARFAQALGKTADAERLFGSALNYRNLFDTAAGWFRGRNPDGSWMPDGAGCVESNPLQQGWFVPQDVAGLIDLVGGKDNFISQLNQVFVDTPASQMKQWNNYYNHSNEPVHQMSFMFAYAGAPWLTQKWSRFVCDNAYSTGPYGLVGNDDVGQMSAWYVFASAGLYPVAPASGTYVIGSPSFAKATFRIGETGIRLGGRQAGGGRTFSIEAADNSSTNIYVQSATLNGRPLTRAWLTHDEMISGGSLVLRMGPQPNTSWGSSSADAPPSLSS